MPSNICGFTKDRVRKEVFTIMDRATYNKKLGEFERLIQPPHFDIDKQVLSQKIDDILKFAEKMDKSRIVTSDFLNIRFTI